MIQIYSVVFPAHAGVIPQPPRSEKMKPGIPRACGGDPRSFPLIIVSS